MHSAQKLRLQDIHSFFIFLRLLVCLVVFPAHRLFALLAANIANDMSACCHAALGRFGLVDVDDGLEEIGFAMLAAEVLVREQVSIVEVKEQRRTGFCRLSRKG